jgi:hypothetical protein
LAFIIALLLAILTAALAADTSFTKWVLALINGFLIFSSAVGVNQGITARNNPDQQRREPKKKGKDFFADWF